MSYLRHWATFLRGALLMALFSALFLRGSSEGQTDQGGGHSPRFTTGHGYGGRTHFRGEGQGVRTSGYGSSGRPAGRSPDSERLTATPDPTGGVSTPAAGNPRGTTEHGAIPSPASETKPGPRQPRKAPGKGPSSSTGDR